MLGEFGWGVGEWGVVKTTVQEKGISFFEQTCRLGRKANLRVNHIHHITSTYSDRKILKPFLVFKQSGVIPYRIRNNEVEVLLITSSRRKRWVIPKGWVEPFMTPAASAAKEAREEAGIIGIVITPAIGSYEYRKWGGVGRVEVFLMRVEQVLEDWDEAHLRKREWVSISKAIDRIKVAELKQMLETLPLQVPAI